MVFKKEEVEEKVDIVDNFLPGTGTRIEDDKTER